MHILFCKCYGCETWCHVERIKRKVLDNRVLRSVFETEREEEAGRWRELHSGRFCDLYCTVGGFVICTAQWEVL